MSDSGEENAGAERSPGGSAPFAIHPMREAIVGEVHARPFRPIETPRVVHHLAFVAGEVSEGEVRDLARFCSAHGAPRPADDARHHVVALGGAELRWERHTEFVTLTLSVAPPSGDPFKAPNVSSLAAFLPRVPGELLVATRLAMVRTSPDGPDISMFDRSSLCLTAVDGGHAVVATDFRPDASGFTRILIEDRGLGAERAGALIQRMLEIETYRTLALLGLPEAQRLGPLVGEIEQYLARLTAEMRQASGYDSSRRLLDHLVAVATEIESESAAVAYRFGATHAYEEITWLRLKAVREERVPGFGTIESFLARRMKPAMHTCRAVEMRLADLSRKLARSAQLLRTRVDIELESQNRNLLESMNRRARLQLRLQRTVEGLSVAAVSYYVVGLIGYLARGGEDMLGWPVEPVHATAVAVPVVVLAVWLMVRRIRRHVED